MHAHPDNGQQCKCTYHSNDMLFPGPFYYFLHTSRYLLGKYLQNTLSFAVCNRGFGSFYGDLTFLLLKVFTYIFIVSLYICGVVDDSLAIMKVVLIVSFFKRQHCADSIDRWICDRCRRKSRVDSRVVRVARIGDVVIDDAGRTLTIGD